MNQINPLSHSHWRHYKSSGGEDYTYEVLGIAIHSETQEEMVIYKTLYESRGENGKLPFPKGTTFVRPLSMWFDMVEWNGNLVWRFTEM